MSVARRAQQALQISIAQARTSSLARLKADEDLLIRRKENIRRFGATWMRPAGVSKTLQAETEERIEREEQEILARREQMMLDMQAEQEAVEARQRAEANDAANAAPAGAEDDMGEGERDLDDEIPDAEEMDEDEDSDEESDEDTSSDSHIDVTSGLQATTISQVQDVRTPVQRLAEYQDHRIQRRREQQQRRESGRAEVTFNDDSVLEGSMLADRPAEMTGDNDEHISRHAEMQARQAERYSRLEEAELTGVAQEQMDLGMDADLDMSVPEADGGEYEHTDTELEDSTDLDATDVELSRVNESAGELPLAGAAAEASFTGRLRNINDRNSGFGAANLMAGGRSSFGSVGNMSSFLESSFLSASPSMAGYRQRPTSQGGRGPNV